MKIPSHSRRPPVYRRRHRRPGELPRQGNGSRRATFDAAGILAGMIVITAIALLGDAILAGLARAASTEA